MSYRVLQETIRKAGTVDTSAADEENSSTKKSPRAKIFLAFLAVIIISGIVWQVVARIQSEQKFEAANHASYLENKARYASYLDMDYAADPDLENKRYDVAVNNQNSKLYQRVEFVMEIPSPGNREKGIIYFAPDYTGKTQERLDKLNMLLVIGKGSSFAAGADFPVTIDRLITDQENVEVHAIDNGFLQGKAAWRKDDLAPNLKDGLYGKIFLMQAVGYSLTAGEGVDKDGYMADFNQAEFLFNVYFAVVSPSIEDITDRSAYLYPHEDGHTETLIANLNGIIAEQPELLDGTGLAAPLTLDNVLNDRESVWKIIHRLDSGQMARFRTH